MRNDHGFGPEAEGRVELLDIQAPRFRIDVDQHGRRTDGLDTAKITGEVVCGQDYLIAVVTFKPRSDSSTATVPDEQQMTCSMRCIALSRASNRSTCGPWYRPQLPSA